MTIRRPSGNCKATKTEIAWQRDTIDRNFRPIIFSCLTQMMVLFMYITYMSILLYILVCVAASLFCAFLTSVQVSAPCVMAGIVCILFRQMTRLLLKRSI